MIVPKQDIIEITGIADSVALDASHKAVEREIKNYCGWEIESFTYKNQLLDGTGSGKLWPGPKNITALVRASTCLETAINFKHSTASSNAYGVVTYTDRVPTSLGLVVADGTTESSTTELFTTYTTMTLLVAQINARSGNGWSAELNNSDYGIFGSTNLIEKDNIYAGTQTSSAPGWSELMMPGQPADGITVERTEGGLFRSSGWPSGTKNIPVTYTAGWTTADMPEDIQNVIVHYVQIDYDKTQAGGGGIKSFSLLELDIEYETSSTTSGSSSSSGGFAIGEARSILDTRYRIKTIV